MSELEQLTATLKHEARVKLLEAKVLKAICFINIEEQRLALLSFIANTAAWCIKNCQDNGDDLDKHWRQQCHSYKQQNIPNFNYTHILCLINGLNKSDIGLLEKITVEMSKNLDLFSIPVVKNKVCELETLHDVAFHHVVNVDEAMEKIKQNVKDINNLNPRNKTPLDEAYAILNMRGDSCNCKFIQFLKSLGALEGDEMIPTRKFFLN